MDSPAPCPADAERAEHGSRPAPTERRSAAGALGLVLWGLAAASLAVAAVWRAASIDTDPASAQRLADVVYAEVARGTPIEAARCAQGVCQVWLCAGPGVMDAKVSARLGGRLTEVRAAPQGACGTSAGAWQVWTELAAAEVDAQVVAEFAQALAQARPVRQAAASAEPQGRAVKGPSGQQRARARAERLAARPERGEAATP